jgi:hypothetical protein
MTPFFSTQMIIFRSVAIFPSGLIFVFLISPFLATLVIKLTPGPPAAAAGPLSVSPPARPGCPVGLFGAAPVVLFFCNRTEILVFDTKQSLVAKI